MDSKVGEAGRQFYEHRHRLMKSRQEGLTKAYNRLHDQKEIDDDVTALRDLQVGMDSAVAAAYGWSDLPLRHGFHETKQGTRFTISEAARREVLARLLKLNHERYAEEVAQGFHDKGKGKGKPNAATKSAKGRGKPSGPGLFDV